MTARELGRSPGRRPVPPPGEAPLLCEGCSQGCLGHRARCDYQGCECPTLPGHVPARYRTAQRRASALAGYFGDDRALVSAALRLAAERYERDAREAGTRRLRLQFHDQATRCLVIAGAMEP